MTVEPGRRRAGRYLLDALLVVVGLAILVPFGWLFTNSLSSSEDTFSLPPVWWPEAPTLDNYAEMFTLLPFGRQILNSVLVTVVAVAGSLLVSVLAAYAFARLRWRGRTAVFGVMLGAMMIPASVMVVPLFIVLRELRLLDTLASLWLPALIQVFSIFLLRQHFLAIPREVEEAAVVDGASRLRILFGIFVPMSGSVLSALAILVAQTTWNDFVSPSIFLVSPEKMTVPVGLVQLQDAYGDSPTLVVFAGITLVTLPLLVLFLFTQPALTRGVAMQGISR